MKQQQPRKKKYAVLLLCLMLSFFAWFTLKMSENYTAKYELEVVFTDIPPDKTLVNYSDSTLLVTFEDKGLSLLSIEFFSKKLKINYDEITSSYQKKHNNICLQENQIIRYIQSQRRFSKRIKSIHPEKICLRLKDNEE